MEVDVRTVPGMQTCFAALPLHLIRTLQTTYSGLLPPLLVLELRPLDHAKTRGPWHVAWIGAASQSTAIEVAEKLAECIGLPDFIPVHVRAQADLPKATMVMLEPASEDDWEILELNADFAEEHILNQVGIVQEGLRFPLWLHGHTIITFHVASTLPKKLVGTELAVAPKRRNQNMSSTLAAEKTEFVKDNFITKASLRVQELDRSLIQTCKVGSFVFGVVPTCVAFISPETGKGFSLSNGQLAVLTSIYAGSKITQNNLRHPGRKNGQSYVEEKANSTITNDNKGIDRKITVRLIFLESAARGHVMLARSLCLYIGANIHTRVLVKGCTWPLNKQLPGLLLSPIYFKISEGGKSHKDNESDISDDKDELLEHADARMESDIFVKEKQNMDWTKHKEFLASIDCIQPTEEEDCDASKDFTVHSKNLLLQSWIAKQINVMSKYVPGQELGDLVIGKETVLHFEVDSSSRRQGKRNGQLATDQIAIKRNTGNGNIANDVMFLLSAVYSNESSHGSEISVGYSDRKYPSKFHQLYALKENSLSVENQENIQKSELEMVEVKLGQPLSFVGSPEKLWDGNSGPPLSSLSWMEPAASEALNRLTLLLSPKSDKIFSNLGLPLPGHVLLHGPPGSGKTQLALSLARCLGDDRHILAHIVFVNCSELVGEQAQAVRGVLSTNMSEAFDHAPSIVVLDNLDSVISSPTEPEGSEFSSSTIALAEFLADLMDACQDRGKRACGIALVAFLAVVRSPGALPGCLCSSGRFDFHVQLSAPAAAERAAILKHEISSRGLQCSDHVTSDTASKCDGYDASDLEVLVDRAVHTAAARSLSPQRSQQLLSSEKCGKPELLAEDFSQALENFLPAAMRGIAKPGSQGGRIGWEDVGGLTETRNAIQEMLELPVKFSKLFAEAPLRLRSGVLLYGPPGCGKTHIVGAAAAACSLRFISVKGPELLNKYIGASEQAVRDIFSKASATAPCILFFDEFDSIAPKRGHDNTGVTDRVVNQLLTELDGVEALTGVFVFAATSRPDLLDAALLRPGRLDRLLFCDFPSAQERLEILKVLSRKLPLAPDVDLAAIASVTEGFSGADLQALLSDAQLESIHGFLECATSGHPLITNPVLKSVALKARPSVPEPEKRRLFEIYSQFLNSRTSVAAKAREAKGKRVTLA